MSGETLLALAERCEQVSGPDRELDRQVALATGWAIMKVQGDDWLMPPTGRPVGDPRRYTASLDAALTLVPEGWGWLVSQPNAKALASGLLKMRTPVMGEVQYGCDQRFAVAAAAPALALCAAALRARAHQETSNDG